MALGDIEWQGAAFSSFSFTLNYIEKRILEYNTISRISPSLSLNYYMDKEYNAISSVVFL